MVSRRISLQRELEKFMGNVYFQPPSNYRMQYPCIVYSKQTPYTLSADDSNFLTMDSYNVTVIEKDPDSDIADRINQNGFISRIVSRHTVDNLYQTVLNIHY